MWWLTLASLVEACVVHWRVRRLWLAIPLAALLGPILLLAGLRVATGEVEAFGLLLIVLGQVVALPVSVIVGAVFHAGRGGPGADNPCKPTSLRGAA